MSEAPAFYDGLLVTSQLCSVADKLQEIHLAALWAGQRFPREALRLREGGELRVIYRGREVRGPGPDFRDAMIGTPAGLLKGDIELHVRASDFRRHGHEKDEAYNGVILHLVFWDDLGEDTLLASGTRAPVIALAPWVGGQTAEIVDWLAQPPLWEEPCRTAVDRLGGPEVRSTLQRLGLMRLRQKAACFAKAGSDEEDEQFLYAAILECLGYSQNREPFFQLAQRLPWAALRTTALVAPPAARAGRVEELLLVAAEAPPPLVWHERGLRRQNRPSRRLSGGARLLARYLEGGLVNSLIALVSGGEVAPLLAGLAASAGGQGLVGASRALEIAANAVIPFALARAEARSDRPLAKAAEALYALLPRGSDYGDTRHLRAALIGVRTNGFQRQQGMLYLHRGYCTQGGCGRCPLS